MNRAWIKVRPLTVAFIFAGLSVITLLFQTCTVGTSKDSTAAHEEDTFYISPAALFTSVQVWTAPDSTTIPKGEEGKMISYGHTLMIHTSKYFGPHGTISQSTNGLNCQNCHLD